MESDKPPHDKEKDSLPILPQTAVRQTTDFTMPMHMSFTDEDLEESTSSSSEDGSLSPNQSGFLPNIASFILKMHFVFKCKYVELRDFHNSKCVTKAGFYQLPN